jgi:hypothetical protein
MFIKSYNLTNNNILKISNFLSIFIIILLFTYPDKYYYNIINSVNIYEYLYLIITCYIFYLFFFSYIIYYIFGNENNSMSISIIITYLKKFFNYLKL